MSNVMADLSKMAPLKDKQKHQILGLLILDYPTNHFIGGVPFSRELGSSSTRISSSLINEWPASETGRPPTKRVRLLDITFSSRAFSFFC